jgi:hypothetical protein
MFNAVPYDARPFDGTQVDVPVPPGLLLPVSWFLVLQPGGALESAALGPFRDDDALYNGSDNKGVTSVDSVVGLLYGTGEFETVIYSRGPDRARDTSNLGRVAVVTPQRWTEKNEGSQRRKLRTVYYLITIRYLAEETEEARSESDRLEAAVQDVLMPATFGGFTLPWLNSVTAGNWDDSGHPTYTIKMNAQFTYGYDIGTGLRKTS